MSAIALLMLGCVVRYGDPVETVITEEIAAPVSFSEIEARLDQMLVGLEDIDRVDRLQAARDLARHMKSQSPEAQRLVLDYLTVLVEVEERADPMDVWARSESEMATFISMPEVQEEALIDEESLIEEESLVEESLGEEGSGAGSEEAGSDDEGDPAVRIAPRAGPNTATMIDSARGLLEAGDPLSAMAALEGCLGEECWAEVAGLWAHARDLHVYQRREEAAELFLRARAEPNAELRARQLREVEEMLYKLLASYPNTRYAPAIQRNVELVQGELSTLSEKE